MQKLSSSIPLSLYIHLPWCVKKCPYCDFNSHAVKEQIPEDQYVLALLKDFTEQYSKIHDREIISIFFGGGTPSLFSPLSINKLLKEINNLVSFAKDIEITLEANPGTVDESRFKGFRAAGVNRLSLGLQSLQNDKLKILGRIHDRNAALRAIDAAVKAGFDNFNLDLMHGLPTQTVDDAMQDLQDAINFNPTHLSWYQLTIEPNTLFYHQPPTLPADEILWDIQEAGKTLLAKNNYLQYEVSAYSLANKNCAHNKNYWEFGDYLGIGAGAHSKLTINEKVIRHWQVKHPKDYLSVDRSFVMEEKIISEQDLIFEFMLNALRLNDGVSIDLFLERTGLPIASIKNILDKTIKKNLLYPVTERIQPTEFGKRFLNDVIAMFLPK